MISALKTFLHRLNGSDRIKGQLELQTETLAREIAELRQIVVVLRDDVLALGREGDAKDDTDFPVYIQDGQARFTTSRHPFGHRAFLVSMPKSGTYFIAEILGRLGLANAGVHLDEHGFTDYRQTAAGRDVADYTTLQHRLPLHKSVRLLADGQFAVGHLAHTTYTTTCLRGFRVVFSKRELRTALVSHMRYFMHPQRGLKHGAAWKVVEDGQKRMEAFMALWGQELISWYKSIAPWTKDDSALVISYETLFGHAGEEAQLSLLATVAGKLGLDAGRDRLAETLRAARSAQTLTKSESPSTIERFWSADCERIFIDTGGGDLNQFLGYSGMP